jgi:membrane-bound metal-dependent hydrolase YbcI (DUF457 family)
MDPLSHALIGGLTAKTARVSRRRFWIMALLGMAPDLDVFANYLGSWAFMFQHRGITHSLLGMLIQPVLFAWALGWWDKGSFKQRAIHYSLPMCAHLLSDALTCFGVPLWAPFSFKEYSLDLVASLNLIPLVIMAAGIWWLHRGNRHGWKETRLFWACWALYLSICMTQKTYASKLFNSTTIVTLPSTVQSFTWRGVEVDHGQKHYRTYSFDLLKGSINKPKKVAMPSSAFPVQASMASPEVKSFLENNRWPVARFSQENDVWVVDWGTLMFSTQGLVRGKVRVRLSSEGDILSNEKIVTFWDPEFVS